MKSVPQRLSVAALLRHGERFWLGNLLLQNVYFRPLEKCKGRALEVYPFSATDHSWSLVPTKRTIRLARRAPGRWTAMSCVL